MLRYTLFRKSVLSSFGCMTSVFIDTARSVNPSTSSIWSGWWASNPLLQLGRLVLYVLSYTRLVRLTGLEPVTTCLGGRYSIQLSYSRKKCGAAGGTRTPDLRGRNPLLLQLSYSRLAGRDGLEPPQSGLQSDLVALLPVHCVG